MKYLLWLMAFSLAQVQAMGIDDDPILGMVKIHQLETRGSDEDHRPWVLEADAWLGTDLHKLWLKTDVEWVDNEWEEAELQLRYSRAIAPYWDVQIGWRGDLRPEPKRHWLALGLHGVAPYYFETDVSLFIGESGHLAARLKTEYELMLTQRLVLMPELSLNLHSKDDEERGIGAGLSDMHLGLRLGYEIKREFAPYIGVQYHRSFGKTADFQHHDEDAAELQWVLGVRAWF